MNIMKDINRKTCEDCICDENADFVHYIFCSRCEPCSDIFQAKLRAKRAAENAAAKCEECGVLTGSTSFDYCEECCEHDFDPDEGNMCLSCGQDGTEDVMSAAYDRAKDYQKYGE